MPVGVCQSRGLKSAQGLGPRLGFTGEAADPVNFRQPPAAVAGILDRTPTAHGPSPPEHRCR
jgi:hypothetical protein